MEMRPRNSANKALYRNQYHDRARDNFRYWLIERPKPTSFGKYGLGSYKTVLGIGNAPRTWLGKYSTGAYKAILGLCMAPRT